MSSVAQYASTPVVAMAQISTANTGRDGSGTIADVLTGSENGTRVDDITVVATGNTTAGVVRLYICDGTNTRLWREILVTAVTVSTSVAVWSSTLSNLALILKPGWKLRASTHNAETFNVIVTRAGDF